MNKLIAFLDPNIYCYTSSEWLDGSFEARLQSLLEFLTDLECTEEQMETETTQLLLLPDEILLASYSMNPIVNKPPNDFYYRQYLSKILPSLHARRAVNDLEERYDAAVGVSIDLDDCIVSEEMLDFFNNSWPEEFSNVVYVYADDRKSLALGSRVFFKEVLIASIRGRYFLNEHSVYPIENKRDPARALIAAIKILKERAESTDSTWRAHKINGLFLHDEFIPSVARSDFREFVTDYQARILFTILQIVTARNITANEHSMKPQKVKYKDKFHGKWNAYVFQNGPCERDTRCSRIYFAKIDGGVVLHEYIESAH